MEAPNAVIIIPLKLQLADHGGITGFAKGRVVRYTTVRISRWCAGIAVSTLGPLHRAGGLEPANRRLVRPQPRGMAVNGAGGMDPYADTCLVANSSRRRWVASSSVFLPGP